MIRPLLSLFLAGALLSGAAAADLKFGVVDMSKAFSEFHKTKLAVDKYKANVDKAQREMNERWTGYKTLMDGMQKLKKEISDPISSPEVRNKKAVEFEEKAKQLRELEQEISEMQNRRTTQLKQEDVEIRRGIYDEILVAVRAKAETEGFDLVFDRSGMSLSTVPVLLYYKDVTDLTDLVIAELNKKPAEGAESAEAPKKP